ncbi:MAG: preprotein translocase subunit SecE [Deltaproteobacteria bacterium]|nr:preprotein translocase subunit SecE [Deltaproteobacteria bacterium]
MKTGKKKQKGGTKKTRSASEDRSVMAQGLNKIAEDRVIKKQKAAQPSSKKTSEKKQEDSKPLFKSLVIALQFLKEAKGELKKVKWPTRKELMATTVMVIIFVLILAFFLGGVDWFLNLGIAKIVG